MAWRSILSSEHRRTIGNGLIVLLTLAPFVFFGWMLVRPKSEPVREITEQKDFFLNLATTSTPRFDQNLSQVPPFQPEVKADVFVQFALEAYDRISQVHWKMRTEEEVTDIFLDGYARATLASTTTLRIPLKSREGLVGFLVGDLAPRTETEKRRIAIETVTNVLALLEPFGRNTLMSVKEEVTFRKSVSNINPEKDLYADVGVPKGAKVEEVIQKFDEKKVILEASTTPEAKVELEKVTYAKEVLTNTKTRERYNTALIEPTVFHREVGERFLYVHIKRVAPTTFSEFQDALRDASSSPKLDSLVIDLRGNVGGALIFSTQLFGAYLGEGVPVLVFQHHADIWKENTVGLKMKELDRYQKQIVIVDRGTLSTAEVVSSIFKKKKLALVIGERSAGWGTIENTFPMQTSIDPTTKYTLFLVHSLTLRDDGLPIQGDGVTPDVDVTKSGWGDEISRYFGDTESAKTVFQILTGDMGG